MKKIERYISEKYSSIRYINRNINLKLVYCLCLSKFIIKSGTSSFIPKKKKRKLSIFFHNFNYIQNSTCSKVDSIFKAHRNKWTCAAFIEKKKKTARMNSSSHTSRQHFVVAALHGKTPETFLDPDETELTEREREKRWSTIEYEYLF